jgi:hypothetical protein
MASLAGVLAGADGTLTYLALERLALTSAWFQVRTRMLTTL